MATTTANITAAIAQITRYTHDNKTSARLLYAVREDNRSKSLQWCVTETIEKLIRDRR